MAWLRGRAAGDRYGQHTELVPAAGTQQRAAYDMWCCFILSELDAQSLYMHRKHVGLKDVYGDAPVAVRAARAYFEKHVAVVAQELEAQVGGWAGRMGYCVRCRVRACGGNY